MAEKAIEKFLARAIRLYEQEREEPCGSPQLGLYVRRRVGWVKAGLKNINLTASWDMQTKPSKWSGGAVSYAK